MTGEGVTVAQGLSELWPPPLVLSSTDGRKIAIFRPRKCIRRSALRRPSLQLSGQHFDRRNSVPRRSLLYLGVSLATEGTWTPLPIRLPRRGMILPLGFSPDSARLALGIVGVAAVELAWVDCGTGVCHGTGVALNAASLVLGRHPAIWTSPDSLLCLIPTTKAGVHADHTTPVVYDTTLGSCPAEWLTYANRTSEDIQAIREHLTSQLCLFDVRSNAPEPVARSGIFNDARLSPDRRYVLTTVHECDSSSSELPRTVVVEVLERRTGRKVRTLDTLDVSLAPWDQGRLDLGATRRWWQWIPGEPATLAWTEREEAALGEVVRMWAAPFIGAAELAFATRGQIARLDWSASGRMVVGERRDDGRVSFWLGTLSHANGAPEWHNLKAATGEDGDWHAERLLPTRRELPNERGTAAEVGNEVFLTSRTGSADRPRSVVRAIDSTTGAARTIWESPAAGYEEVVAVLNGENTALLIRSENPETPAWYSISETSGNGHVRITQRRGTRLFRRTQTRRIQYAGFRGWLTSCNVHLPAAAVRDGTVPFLIWVYPHMGPSALRAVRPLNRYPEVRKLSPAFMLAHGYGVIDLPGLRISTRRAMVSELTEQMGALVESLLEDGYADGNRLAIGGHCAGGNAALILSATTGLFRAAIACSPYVNSTVQPRKSILTTSSLWEEPDAYTGSSAFFMADRIRSPVLLIHGAEEQLPVDPRSQSQPLFAALASRGAVARIVALPCEDHFYEAEESIRYLRREVAEWCNRHSGDRGSVAVSTG